MRRMNLNDDPELYEDIQAMEDRRYSDWDFREDSTHSDRRYKTRNDSRNVRMDRRRYDDSTDNSYGYSYHNRRPVNTYYNTDRESIRRTSFWGRGDESNYRHRRWPRFERRGYHSNTGWGHRSFASSQVIFWIILFIAIAVLFKWIILKNSGMTAVALFIIIIVFMGHLRDK